MMQISLHPASAGSSGESGRDIVTFELCPTLSNDELNVLFAAAWPGHPPRDFSRVLGRSFAYFAAHQPHRLVGFVNLVWDGGVHGFILDPTVHPEVQRRGIGRELIRRTAAHARKNGLEWLHVDYQHFLEPFYRACGFKPCPAGLLHLKQEENF